MNLSQEQAQKLINEYAKQALKLATGHKTDSMKAWTDMQTAWRDEMKNDPELGKLLGSNQNFGPDSPIVITVNKALDSLQNPKLAAAFKDAMDLTGAGNHPAFVKVFYALARQVTEGSSYASGGNPPAPEGRRPSAAAALYPNLPSGAS